MQHAEQIDDMPDIMDTPDGEEGAALTSPLDALGHRLHAEFEDAKATRHQYEEQWLQDLRQYKGIYDSETLTRIQPGRSRAFIRLTRTKVKTMDARMRDLLFPPGADRNWSIDATPVAEIDPAEREHMRQVIHSFRGEDPPEEVLQKMAQDVAKRRASRMGEEIEDQLVEGKYINVCRKVIHSGNLYGTGILKGPLVERRVRRKWSGSYTDRVRRHFLNEKESLRPYFEFVSLWDFYPDLSADSLEDCEYIFQRHVMNRAELRKLGRREGFDDEAINKYIRENPNGDASFLYHETELRNIAGSLDSANDRGRRYQLLERWGYLDGQDLRDAGIEVAEEDLDREYESVIWMLGPHVIFVDLNPFEAQTRPYHTYQFEQDDVGIFVDGIAKIMRDTQVVFNAAVRATLDNAAISAGPQGEVNMDLIEPNEDPNDVFPFRNLKRRGRGEDARSPAQRWYSMPNHTKELINMANQFKQWGDEAVAIPSYTHGEQDKGVAKTVGGLSMLMGASQITIKDVVQNYDLGITRPFIEGMYHWNMQFNDREDIKGDFEVDARGSSSLVAKEMRAQQINSFRQSTANPVDGPLTDRAELLREEAASLDLDESVVISEEEMQAAMHNEIQPQGAIPGDGQMAGAV
ncbi:MAG: hypothetical protein LAT50_13705 [Ectothiorhodospiraceae bacterium]|nr:hypothetical protein [Ectothiorhodospiraceae bacterium]